MKQNGVVVSVLMLLAVLLAACAPVQAAEAQNITGDLSWPDHKGRQEIVKFDHDNYCANSSECLFFGSYAFENVAIGNATLSVERIDGLGVLRVDGIDSTLTNGVLQYLPETTVMETFLLVPNFSLSSEGATLKTTQVGIVDGEPDQEFSTM